MSTLFPRGMTPEILEQAKAEHTEQGNCKSGTPGLFCMAHKLLNGAHEVIERGPNPRGGLLMMLVMALSTGIEIARAAPEWSLASQDELDRLLSKDEVVEPPTSHEVLREIIQHFAERHPIDIANNDQDIVKEKVENERYRQEGIDPAHEAAQAEAGQ